MRGWAKWAQGSGRCKLPVMEQTNHGNERYSIGNTVTCIAVAWYGDRW